MSFVKFFPVDKVIVNNLGTADTLGKIIGEPIVAIIQLMTEKSKMEMQIESDKHDLEKNKEMAKIDAEIRKWNADIDDYISYKEIERNQKIMDAILEYRSITIQTMSTIIKNLNAMQVELVGEAHKLLIDKFSEYQVIQEKSIKNCDERLEEIQKKYADNERLRIKMEDTAISQMEGIIKTSEKFIAELDEDIRDMVNKNIGRIDEATKFVDGILKNWGKGIETYDRNFQIEKYIEQKNKTLLN